MTAALKGIEISENRKTLTLHASDGRVHAFDMTLESIEQLAATLTATSVSMKQERAGGATKESADPSWAFLPMTHVTEPVPVGQSTGTSGPALAVVFGYGSPFQTAYAIALPIATQLAHDLLAEAERIRGGAPDRQH